MIKARLAGIAAAAGRFAEFRSDPLDLLRNEPRADAGRQAGWRVVASKEFADHIRSVRFWILIALMSLAALATVFAVGGAIRGVAEGATGFPALFLRLFTVGPSENETLPSLFELVALMGPLLGIMFAFDAVNSERSQGTLPRLLAQPIYRDDVINGKFMAGLAVIGLIIATLMLAVAGVGMFRIGVVPTAVEIGRVITWLVVTLFYVGFWLALSTLLSVWLKRASTSALAAIAAWLVSTLFAGILVGIAADTLSPVPEQPSVEEQIANAQLEQNLSRIFPGTLYEDATIALLQPEVRTLGFVFARQLDRAVPSDLSLDQSLLIVWPQVAGLVALTLLCFAGAYVVFMRQEVRA